MRRTVALFLVLLAAYAGTLGMRAFDSSEYGGDEPRYLLAADSIVHDGDIDLRNQYEDRAYAAFYPYRLTREGRTINGALREPQGLGFPLLIAPAYALGGAGGVELFLALVAALAVTLAYRLALRVAPDPWAIGAAAAVGLSPVFIAYGTAVYAELAAGAVLAAAALLALRLDTTVSRRASFACFGLLGLLPWLGARFVPAGIVVGVFAARSLLRARRRTLTVGSVEISLFSVALYVGINEGLFGGPSPHSADAAGGSVTGADFPLGYVERAYRLVALLIDRNYGLLRWAPVFALAGAGLWLLYRSRREGLARVLPEVRDGERTATLCALALAAQLLVAAFLAPTIFGFWFPTRHLLATLPLAIPLAAWGLRHAPRAGTALALFTVAGSAWLFLAVRLGDSGLARNRPDAPLGPLVDLLPDFDSSRWPAFALAAALGVALLGLVAWEARRRRTPGPTYSG